jgi:hypothetical protein
MNCNDFFIWLQNRSVHKQTRDPGILGHIQECDACRQLYDMDTCLEACIQQSFALQKLPAGLAKKINHHIDEAIFSHPEHFSRSTPWEPPEDNGSPDRPVKK